MGPTLDQLLKAPKVTQAALAGYLAIVKSNYEALGHVPAEYQGACNVPIPVEVIELIGEKLVSQGVVVQGRTTPRRRSKHANRTPSGRQRPMPFG